MISYIAILICVNLLRSDTYTQADSNILGGENDVNCEEMKQPGWSLFSLANKTLDAWPWRCLNSRYNETTLSEEVSKLSPDIFDATAKDYIGYVQYYFERRKINLCNPNGVNERNPMYLIRRGTVSLTMYAASFGRLNILKYLLKEINIYKLTNFDRGCKSVYIHSSDLDGSLYPLALVAAKGGHQHVLKYLVEEEGFIIEEDDGILLGIAVIGGNVNMFRYLICEKHMIADINETIQKSKDIDVFGCEDLTLLCIAAGTNNLDAFIYLYETLHFTRLLNYDKKPQWSRLLLVAMRVGGLPMIKHIIENFDGSEGNANANISLRFNALLVASGETVTDDLKIVQFLVDDLKMISQIDQVDDLNETAAMKAASCRKLDVLKFLVDDRHANIAIMPPTNKTLLHFAVSSSSLNPGLMPILKYLIEEKGFKVSARTATSETVLDIARRTLLVVSPDGQNSLAYLTEKLEQELSTKN